MKEESINNLFEKLKDVRLEQKILNDKYEKVFDIFKEDNKKLINYKNGVNSVISEHESTLREYMSKLYLSSGIKKTKCGVGVRLINKIEYSDDDALNWAKQHDMALNLDKRAFEKIAKTINISFVKTTEVVQPTIPKIEV